MIGKYFLIEPLDLPVFGIMFFLLRSWQGAFRKNTHSSIGLAVGAQEVMLYPSVKALQRLLFAFAVTKNSCHGDSLEQGFGLNRGGSSRFQRGE